MKIAIIGAGIAGNLAAYRLCRDHEITLFEANTHVGGHTHTHDIAYGGRHYAVDTGFIVFNYQTYPHFTRLLQELDVAVQASTMSFSVKCERSGLEYNGNTLNTLFAQRCNLFNLSFYGMLKDIMRFNREAPRLLENQDMSLSLGDFLQQKRYGREFIERYLVPMGAAIWSTDPQLMYRFPAGFFIRFFHNHGLLSVNDRPQWYVIEGGSREYVRKLSAAFADRIRTRAAVETISRHPTHVDVKVRGEPPQRFDRVFIATHSDQALRLLRDATPLEREILGAIPYQANEAVLHTDTNVLPRRRLAWAAWNYHILRERQQRVPVTYNMNILQNIEAPVQFCVTLNNADAIDPRCIIKRIRYQHPIFTPASVAAQRRQHEINAGNRTYYCGAYWGYGFHEDGVVSTLNALDHFSRDHYRYAAQLPLRRAS
jgi:predicted NAD/FAD-binding protein